ncbi:MAG: 2-aminoethylphosphonate--pyruvate transaminase [Methanoregula sp.]|nr:2-aminoethylphosphonate--pyruvate transaminase [Methanoregula sp.]
MKRTILLSPGPATTTDSVKQALVVPDICPREREFSTILRGICKDLVSIVKGDDAYTAVLFSGSGTAVMDSVINSVVPDNKKIAILVNGAYGERFVQIAQSYGILYEPVLFEWGTTIDTSRVEAVLKNDPAISCIAMVHHETTTGILNPLDEIGLLADKYGCTFIVDAISSFAGIPIDIQQCRADFLLSSSNKCIQGMAGLSFIICRKEALDLLKHQRKRSYYLDLYNQYTYFEKTGQMQFTPPVQVAYALRQAILEYGAEGSSNRYARYTENWRLLRSGLQGMGFQLLLPEGLESHILLTVLEPEDVKFDFDRMHDYLYERGFTVYPGKIRQRSFRLSILGDLYPEDIAAFLDALRAYLAGNGIFLTPYSG